MAALKVVANVLGKNFDGPGDTDYQEREAFYKRFT